MKYYVTADIHGYATEWEHALEQAGYFADREEKRLIVCGDLLDRGQEARRLTERMLELQRAGELIYILGNHEDLLVEALQMAARGDIAHVCTGFHVRNGTWDTLLQLAELGKEEACRFPELLVQRVRSTPFYRELLSRAVDHYETEHYVFCHGWIPTVQVPPMWEKKFIAHPDWRSADYQEWRTARWQNGMDLACKYRILEAGKTVVCGHWHTSYGHAVYEGRGSEFGEDADFSPFRAEGILAIDACTALTRTVHCVLLEDTPLPENGSPESTRI